MGHSIVDPVRQEVVAGAHTVVVKVGTNVLADASRPARPIAAFSRSPTSSTASRHSGRKVVLVTSGAIGAGVGKLGLGKRPTDLPHLQACAAVGQSALMQLYQESSPPHGIQTAQILLTAGDFDNRARYLNVRNTIRTLFEYGALPIINENDTVSVAEIKFGDNDHLAAMVTNLLRAPAARAAHQRGRPLLRRSANAIRMRTLLATVPHIDQVRDRPGRGHQERPRHRRHAEQAPGGAAGDRRRRGGDHGERFDRRHPRPRVRGRTGRHAVPAARRGHARLEALARLHRAAQGNVRIDAGARRAVVEQGKSLLPVGVTASKASSGREMWSASATARGGGRARFKQLLGRRCPAIRGTSTEQIASLVGSAAYPELVHRDNLVLVG